MPIASICAKAVAGAERACAMVAALIGLTAVAGCGGPERTAAVSPPVTNAQTLQQGVATLASTMVAHAKLPPAPPSGRYPIVIDPWIDATTGTQVATTRLMQLEIQTLAPQHFPQLEPLPFTPASLARKPLVLLGAIVPVTGPGSFTTVQVHPGAYRIYGVLADLKTGTIAANESAWVRPEDVDLSPLGFFRDSPVWLPDESTTSYLRTAVTRAGDPIDPAYVQNLQAEALLASATMDYDDGDYGSALDLYHAASALPQGGHQLRVYDGLYLTASALGQRPQAVAAFGGLVDYSLRHDRLSVKFLFKPGSTAFWPDPTISGSYPMWLRQISMKTAADRACLRIVGHDSPTGSAALNNQLSLARATRIEHDLIADEPALRGRLEAKGDGFRDPLVGTGRDDATDLLDRRVSFQSVNCDEVMAAR